MSSIAIDFLCDKTVLLIRNRGDSRERGKSEQNNDATNQEKRKQRQHREISK
jgi:hypothetical protein